MMNSSTTTPAGYKDVSVPIEEITRSGTVWSLVLLVAPILAYGFVNGSLVFLQGLTEFLLFFLMVAVAIAVHEGLHAAAWMLAGGVKLREIRFGFDLRGFAPYAHARTDMTARAYRVGVLTPGIVLGVIPSIIGVALADGFITLLGAIMLSAAIGDLFVFWIIRDVPGAAWVRDHPSQAGCMVKMENE